MRSGARSMNLDTIGVVAAFVINAALMVWQTMVFREQNRIMREDAARERFGLPTSGYVQSPWYKHYAPLLAMGFLTMATWTAVTVYLVRSSRIADQSVNAPRDLDADQIDTLSRAIGQQPMGDAQDGFRPCGVRIFCGDADKEACKYANKIYEAFIAARWQQLHPPDKISVTAFGGFWHEYGLLLISEEYNPTALQMERTILDKLHQQVSRKPEKDVGCSLQIWVGPRCQPGQCE